MPWSLPFLVPIPGAVSTWGQLVMEEGSRNLLAMATLCTLLTTDRRLGPRASTTSQSNSFPDKDGTWLPPSQVPPGPAWPCPSQDTRSFMAAVPHQGEILVTSATHRFVWEGEKRIFSTSSNGPLTEKTENAFVTARENGTISDRESVPCKFPLHYGYNGVVCELCWFCLSPALYLCRSYLLHARNDQITRFKCICDIS